MVKRIRPIRGDASMAAFAPQTLNCSFRQKDEKFKYCCASPPHDARIEPALINYLYESVRYVLRNFVVFLHHRFTIANQPRKCAIE